MLPTLPNLPVWIDVPSTFSSAGGGLFYEGKLVKWGWIATLDWYALIERLRTAERADGGVSFYPEITHMKGGRIPTITRLDDQHGRLGLTPKVADWGDLRFLISDECPEETEGHRQLFGDGQDADG